MKLMEVIEFQLSWNSLKDDVVKVLHSLCYQIWKTQQWPQDWKGSVFIPILNKGSAKKCSNYRTIAFFSHTSKVILKILQDRLQKFMNCELPDVHTRFRNGRGFRKRFRKGSGFIKGRSNCQHPSDGPKRKRIPEKKSTSALLITPKTFTE